MRLPALVVTSFGLIDHGVVGGILKSMKIDKIHNMHAPKFQGRVFSEVAEAPQAAPTRRTLVGDPEIVKNDKIHKIHAPKIQGRVFSEVAEAPQAATTRRTGLGITNWCQNSVKGGR